MKKNKKIEDSLSKIFSNSGYKMVDVSTKEVTHRKALAVGEIILSSELIKKKIDTLSCDYLLLDRFYDASIAYQGYGRNLSKSFIKNLISFINCPTPNLSILLDINVKEAFSRKIKDKKDRIELSGSDFFNNVRNGYLEIAKDNKERFIIIDDLVGFVIDNIVELNSINSGYSAKILLKYHKIIFKYLFLIK